MVRRWLALLSIVSVLVYGALACSNDDSLNPQPLPPGETEDGKAVGSSSSSGGTSAGGSNSSSSSGGSSSGEPVPPEDTGDAGDAGDAGGDQ